MLTCVLMGLLAQAQGPVKIAMPGLNLAGVETGLGEAWSERFATVLARDAGLKVTTRRDIEQLLGLERQKALLGCSEGSSTCLAELAGGLGVDALLSGSLAKAGTGYIVTLRVLRASDGSEVASTSERMKNEDEVSEWLDAEAPRLAERIRVAFGRKTAAPQTHLERWIPGIAGAALLLGGVGLEVGARADAGSLAAGAIPIAEFGRVVERGRTMEAAGWVLVGVGGAGLATSIVWALVAGPGSPQVAVFPVTGGAVVGLSGALP